MISQVKRIALTGISRGLGRALGRELVARGHMLFACARNKASIAELAAEFGSMHQLEVVDVGDAEQVQRWATHVQESGPIDLLVNNAGVINRNARLWELTPQEVDAVVDVNLKGTIHAIRGFVPQMADLGRGVIVNMSSGWGRSVSPEVAIYCATKWGVEGLTKALAAELPSGMAAVALNPGIINTEMLQSCFGSSADSYESPAAWAKRAAPMIEALGARDNGASLTVS